jgi:hypothetical protein
VITVVLSDLEVLKAQIEALRTRLQTLLPAD